MLSLLAAACAAMGFLPYILHSGTALPHGYAPSWTQKCRSEHINQAFDDNIVMTTPVCRPLGLMANIAELFVWLFTTAASRLYWHSAHLHQLPLILTLLWFAKAVSSVLLAVFQANLTSEHVELSFQVSHQAVTMSNTGVFISGTVVSAALHSKCIFQESLCAARHHSKAHRS